MLVLGWHLWHSKIDTMKDGCCDKHPAMQRLYCTEKRMTPLRERGGEGAKRKKSFKLSASGPGCISADECSGVGKRWVVRFVNQSIPYAVIFLSHSVDRGRCRPWKMPVVSGIDSNCGKSTAGVFDSGGALWLANISASFRKNSRWP